MGSRVGAQGDRVDEAPPTVVVGMADKRRIGIAGIDRHTRTDGMREVDNHDLPRVCTHTRGPRLSMNRREEKEGRGTFPGIKNKIYIRFTMKD